MPKSYKNDDLVAKMLSGDRLALSRLISQVEARSKNLVPIMSRVQEKCGHAVCLGITGPPGAGKSTLVDALCAHLRKAGKTVGVVAIDPSSPFSGGAVLGDRIRMQQHANDEGVFIRSLGSRGNHGGLSRATREVVKLYDAFGMDYVLVETVGVGQTELDIMEIADTTLVMLTPESGDAIQTLKAGILEIADVFVVNKADREGADRMQAELKAMCELSTRFVTSPQEMLPRWGFGGESGFAPDFEPKHPASPVRGGWTPPVLLVQAVKNLGVEELFQALEAHRTYLAKDKSHLEKKRQMALQEVQEIILDELRPSVHKWVSQDKSPKSSLKNPYAWAQKILAKKHTLP